MKPGPAPKRNAERIRGKTAGAPATEVDLEADTAELPGALDDPDSLPFKVRQPVVVPVYDGEWVVESHHRQPDPAEGWHPLARDMWDAYSRSGQALFWQPSDWSIAALLCESITRALQPQIIGYSEVEDAEGTRTKDPIWGAAPVKGADLSGILKGAAALGLLEGDRRRMGLELTSRYADAAPTAPPTDADVQANRRGLFAVGSA